MASEFNIKGIIWEKYGLDISQRALKIFIAEFQKEGEDFPQTKERIRNDIESFYNFLLSRTDIPITLKPNTELLELYLKEIKFIGIAIVSLKNYSKENIKLKEALPEMIKIYNDYERKIKELSALMNLPNVYGSKILKLKSSRIANHNDSGESNSL